jgi:hypothetical protein
MTQNNNEKYLNVMFAWITGLLLLQEQPIIITHTARYETSIGDLKQTKIYFLTDPSACMIYPKEYDVTLDVLSSVQKLGPSSIEVLIVSSNASRRHTETEIEHS